MRNTISLIFVIIWLIVIFGFSNMDSVDSDGLSKGLIKDIATENGKDTESANNLADQFNYLVRKFAHAFVYLVLGILVLIYLNCFNMDSRKKIVFCLLFCFFYSLTDEFHQTFIAGRAGQFTDCLIDTFGSCMGIVLYKFGYFVKHALIVRN